MYLIVHTMTITDRNYVVQAQYFHALEPGNGSAVGADPTVDSRLVARKISVKLYGNLAGGSNKIALQRLHEPNLRTLMKKNAAHVKHRLRTFHISQNGSQPVVNTQIVPKLNRSVAYTPQAKPQELTVSNQTIVIEKPMRSEASMSYDEIQLSASANPQQAAKWLVNNRFEKYLSSFTNFSGADMLRMSRDDFMEVCGQADGIRLYNALHLKTIAPKLTLYVSRSRASPYHAIYLNEFSISELQTKLATVLTITPEAVREVYLQGPQGIHVHLEDAVLRHIRDETMFNVILLPERNGGYAFLLKPDISGQNSKGSFEERYEK